LVVVWAVVRLRVRFALLRNEGRDLAFIRKSARAEGGVIRREELMLWQAGPKDWSALVLDEWDVAKAHFATLTGELANAERPMRVFILAERRAFLRYGRRAGIRIPGILDGFFLAAIPGRIIVEMPNPLKRLTDPGRFLRSLFGPALLFGFTGFLARPWLSIGVGGLIGRDVAAGAKARLNRKVLPGVLGARPILNARGLFRLTRRTLFGTSWKRPGEEEFAHCTRVMDQCHSLLDYIATPDAPPIATELFQAFLKNLTPRQEEDRLFRRHFGYGFDHLYNNWSEWVRDNGIGDHIPPPTATRRTLLDHIIPLVADRRASQEDRVQAIRDMGKAGYTLGADTLIDLLEDRDREVRAASVTALEAISGTAGGKSMVHWERWWDRLPHEVKPAALDEELSPPDQRLFRKES
jgi:hypothetical protein